MSLLGKCAGILIFSLSSLTLEKANLLEREASYQHSIREMHLSCKTRKLICKTSTVNVIVLPIHAEVGIM